MSALSLKKQSHDYLLNHLFKAQIKENIKTPRHYVTGLCAGISSGTGEFPAQRASNVENVFIWWRHHDPNQYKLITLLGSYSSIIENISLRHVYIIKTGWRFGQTV